MTEQCFYNTLRVVYSDGRVLPFRSAIEDQFKYSMSACPFSSDGTILVPFQLVLDESFAVVRVQPPGRTSCLVRIAFEVQDEDDLEMQISTRQALVSPDWLFIYDMGIIDLKIRQGVVLVLTHTCAVEFFLCDHDPAPIAMSLPNDRVGVIFSEKYIKFTQDYRAYIQHISQNSVFKFKFKSLDESTLIPPEWTVVCTQLKNDEMKNAFVQLQERQRPRLNLREEMQVVTEPCEDEKILQAVMVFADTNPNLACPWAELAATRTTLYLNTFNGVFLCGADWERLISRKSGQPVYAMSIFATEKDLFVQDSEDKNWRRFDSEGIETVYEFEEPLLNICDGKLLTRDFFFYADPTASTSDTLLGSAKRCYSFNH